MNAALPPGSWVYRNWMAYTGGETEEFAEEIPFFSDARFTGEIRTGLGPYLLLNPVPEPHEPGTLAPALVLRLGVHLPDDTEKIIQAFQVGVPDASGFTGGSTYDEIASLVSLAHRTRIAIGAPSRWFHRGDTDGRGSPRYPSGAVPILPEGRYRNVIPEMARTTPLRTDLLALYPDIEWNSARELARAARSYRQGIWVASSDGNLAWLFLVSAAETAANEWARLNGQPQLTPTELLRSMNADYATRLESAAGESAVAVLNEVGRTQASVMKAQWKFRKFLLYFGLESPQPRPNAGPVGWSADEMRETLGVVYKYRSEALHASKPFPLPMCASPFPSEDEKGARAWSERPGGASYQSGGLWTSEQLPLNLNAFHHLVATALQNWWRSLALNSKADLGVVTA